jgi:hypothetical protein
LVLERSSSSFSSSSQGKWQGSQVIHLLVQGREHNLREDRLQHEPGFNAWSFQRLLLCKEGYSHLALQ